MERGSINRPLLSYEVEQAADSNWEGGGKVTDQHSSAVVVAGCSRSRVGAVGVVVGVAVGVVASS